MRAHLGFVLLSSAIFSSAGCRDPPAAAAVPARSAEEAAARALRGDDDDEGGSPMPGQGAKKWRDTGVYVDGKPVGILSFGELPIALQPIWIEERHSAEIEPGQKGPGYRIVKERRYRFVDYLKAVGVDLARVREIHVMGPKLTEVIVASGAQLRSRLGKGFMFRFGGAVGGKAIPIVPLGFGNAVKPDKISAVMVYVDKVPPVLAGDDGLVLDGIPVTGVPYFGEPLRGGVRVYQDDRLRFVIKRPLLRQTQPAQIVDGKPRYALWSLLEAHGVDTTRLVEGWIVADERYRERLTREQLQALTFEAGDKEKNEILLGPGRTRVRALSLHARALTAADLPQIFPGEDSE
jgi:hypothetical protein